MKSTNTVIIFCLVFFACNTKITSIDLNKNGKIDIYEDNSAPTKERVVDALSRITLEDKAKLVVGKGFSFGQPVGLTKDKVPGAAGNTQPIDVLGLPSIVLADGPAGVRIQPIREGIDKTFYATAFPIETLLSSSWDVDLVEQVGVAMGNEVKEYGVDVLLAPALNIHRNPLAGRNFEYYSEDPVLAGKMTAAMVNGVESVGVGTSIKHFAANNQETNRMLINTIVSERALREIYLKGFEIAVKESQPWTVMSAYNQVNDDFASQDFDLLTKVLREEWGFEGIVMTDWFAGNNAPLQMKAGNDLIMPGSADQTKSIIEAVENGELSMEELDLNVSRILELIFKSPAFIDYKFSDAPDLKAHAEVARKAATEGMILLKNDAKVLPLASTVSKIAAFGNTSYNFISGGTGSGDVNEAYTISLVQGLENTGYEIDKSLQKVYEMYIEEEKSKLPPQENPFMLPPTISEMEVSTKLVEEYAENADLAFITIGRNSGEFSDRAIDGDFYLTETELNMIETVSHTFHAKGKKVIAILNIGNVIEIASWRDNVDAILLAWQGGQEGGNAVADILTGVVNPSGKLPTTFPNFYEDVASSKNFPGENISDEQIMSTAGFTMGVPSEVIYEEGIYVGYRYFSTFNVPTAYEFGFGLSYTNFEFSNLKLNTAEFEDLLKVSLTVTNTGNVAGKEVVQLYLSSPKSELSKPKKELKAFAKTKLLQPGESETILLTLGEDQLTSFNTKRTSWVASPGTYIVKVGNSSKYVPLAKTFNLSKEIVHRTTKALAPSRTINELKK